MSIKIPGSIITLATTTPALSATFTITDFRYRRDKIYFTRPEFSGEKLRAAKNVDGSSPVYFQLSGGRIAQFFTNCNVNETTRPTDPDDSRIDSIFCRWDITRFYITADANDQSVVDTLGSLAATHLVLLAEHDAHLEIARSGDVSFPFLEAMQEENFSYLTNTTLSIAGNSAGGFSGQTNLLITNFQTDVIHEDTPFGTTDKELLSGFQIEIEKRVLRSMRSSSF